MLFRSASNAATALAAVEVFMGESALDGEIVRAAFANATSPGRCEIVMRNPTVIIDAAHNPHGARSLRRTIEEEFEFDAVIGVLASMGDKDVEGIISECEPIFDRVITTKNSSHRAADISKISDIAKKVFGNDRVSSESHLESAIKAAIEAARFEYATNDQIGRAHV